MLSAACSDHQRDFLSILSHATHNKKCVQIDETQRKNGRHLPFVEPNCGATKQLLKYVQYPRSTLSLTMLSVPFRLASPPSVVQGLASFRIDCPPIVHEPN